MRNACLDAVTEELSNAGIKPTINVDGSHVKVEWEHNGQPRLVVTAKTASDHRAALNNRATTRRILKADGVFNKDLDKSKNVVTLKKAFELPERVPPLNERVRQLESRIETLEEMLLEVMTNSGPAIQPVSAPVVTSPAFSIEEAVSREIEEINHTIESVFQSRKNDQEPDTIPVSSETLDILNSGSRPQKKYQHGTLENVILDAMDFKGKSPSEIATIVAKDTNTIGAYLSKLKSQGKVENVRRGIWKKMTQPS